LDKLQIGLTYREEIRAYYEGEARMVLSGEIQTLLDFLGPVMDLMGIRPGQSARFNCLIKMPRQVDFGLAWFPTERLTITTDYVWTNWSVMEAHKLKLEGDGLFGMTEIVTPMDFSDTHSFRMGMDYALTSLFRLRAGYTWDPSPVPDHTLFMSTADADRHVGTVGLALVGLWGGRLRIECAFQYVHLTTRTIAPGVSQNMGGYKNSIGNQYNDTEFQLGGHALKASLGWTTSF
jgi:long-chain fatty acid transport protein